MRLSPERPSTRNVVHPPTTMKCALVLALALGGCAFAQKHPGVTTGIVAGTIGFTSCWLGVEKIGTCSTIGLGVGVTLGGITGLVTTFADTGDHSSLPLTPDEEPFVRRKRAPAATPEGDAAADAPVDPVQPPTDATPAE
jgi:hypothetical protein